MRALAEVSAFRTVSMKRAPPPLLVPAPVDADEGVAPPADAEPPAPFAPSS